MKKLLALLLLPLLLLAGCAKPAPAPQAAELPFDAQAVASACAVRGTGDRALGHWEITDEQTLAALRESCEAFDLTQPAAVPPAAQEGGDWIALTLRGEDGAELAEVTVLRHAELTITARGETRAWASGPFDELAELLTQQPPAEFSAFAPEELIVYAWSGEELCSLTDARLLEAARQWAGSELLPPSEAGGKIKFGDPRDFHLKLAGGGELLHLEGDGDLKLAFSAGGEVLYLARGGAGEAWEEIGRAHV